MLNTKHFRKVTLIVPLIVLIASIEEYTIAREHIKEDKCCLVLNDCPASKQKRFKSPCNSTKEWPSGNYNLCNSRANPFVDTPSRTNAKDLKILWSTFSPTSTAGINGAPIVKDNIVYYADFASIIWARDLNTGRVIWSTPTPGITYAGPLLATEKRIFAAGSDLKLYVLDRATGSIITSKIIDPALPAGQGLVYAAMNTVDNLLFVPLNGNGDFLPTFSFHPTVTAFNIDTLDVVWRFSPNPLIPANPKLGAGVGIWSSPAFDKELKLMYFGTSNANEPPAGNCDTLFALNYQTGEVVWKYQFLSDDLYSATYQLGPDRDIGASPNLFTACINGCKVKAVGVNSKSSIYKVFNRTTGELLWETPITQLNPSLFGNPSAAVKNGVIYTVSTEDPFGYINPAALFAVPPAPPLATITTLATAIIGVVTALDANTGKVLWSRSYTGSILNSITEANGVLYITTAGGIVRALDARNGDILFSYQFPPRASDGFPVVIGAPVTVVNNRVVVTQGIGFLINTPGAGITVFSVPK